MSMNCVEKHEYIYFANSFVKALLLRNICQKKYERKFHSFPKNFVKPIRDIVDYTEFLSNWFHEIFVNHEIKFY